MMASSPSSDLPDLTLLKSYSACDISDALLRLQKPVSGGGGGGGGEVARAGHLVDLVPYAPRSMGIDHAAEEEEQPKMIIGPASTVKLVAKDQDPVPLPDSDPGAIPKGRHWADLTDDGTVVVVEQPDGQSCAAVGGILARAMKNRGAIGCVVGGRVRDLKELNSCGLHIWARGKSTVGSGAECRVFARNVDISIGGVKISPGDILFCDPLEGVVAIPRTLLNEVIGLVPDLVAADDKVKADVLQGGEVAAAFEKYRRRPVSELSRPAGSLGSTPNRNYHEAMKLRIKDGKEI